MYKRILASIDGSNTSNLALDEAIRLANDQKAELRLVHVIDEAMLDGDVEGFMNIATLRNALHQAGEHILKKGREIAAKNGITAETALLETLGARIASAIVDEAERWTADLIVVGTHGRRGFDRFFMGSVAEGVARIAPMPILLVRGR
jgi:nucleotide-binding universal stress UspA family protein